MTLTVATTILEGVRACGGGRSGRGSSPLALSGAGCAPNVGKGEPSPSWGIRSPNHAQKRGEMGKGKEELRQAIREAIDLYHGGEGCG